MSASLQLQTLCSKVVLLLGSHSVTIIIIIIIIIFYFGRSKQLIKLGLFPFNSNVCSINGEICVLVTRCNFVTN